ncbi:MAG TPA: DEAD/DEAH box helicase, partial [Solirubrobacteraceae bacterium]
MDDSPEVPRFADLGLDPRVERALDDVGYETPSPIQAGAIPPLLAGRHVVGLAQTGTGKTAAFALPILSRVDVAHAVPQVLVLAPTR